MTIYLDQLEREWLSRRVTGATAQTPLNQLKKEYYISYLGAESAGLGLWELEDAWLRKYITNKGGNVDNSDDLWKDAVLIVGQVPTPYWYQNKILFYLHATMDLPSQSPSASKSPSSSASKSASKSMSPSGSLSPSGSISLSPSGSASPSASASLSA